MKRSYSEQVIKNKYAHLLVGMIAIFLAAPFFNNLNIKFPVIDFMFLMIIILTLRVLNLKRYVFTVTIVLAALSFSLDFLINLGVFSDTNNMIAIVTILSYGFFMGIALLLLIKNIFSEQCISGDTIKGGMSIYILMGFWWAMVYFAIELFDPNAFLNTIGVRGPIDFLFFSFTTLTTVGYGDTVPKNDIAKVLVSLEAVTGVLYVAIFIARLISLHVLGKVKKD